MSATNGYDYCLNRAVRFLVAAPGALTVPQAMRAANFTDKGSSNQSIQQQVRREWQSRGGRQAASYLTPPPAAITLATSVTEALSFTGSGSTAQEGDDNGIIKKPVLLKVRVTATAKQKLQVNKIRVAKFYLMALKSAMTEYSKGKKSAKNVEKETKKNQWCWSN
jgi:hypothetical protein